MAESRTARQFLFFCRGNFRLSPTDRCFVTQTDNDGNTTIIFGNGVNGARLPTGVENVRAVYRTGIGKEGNVTARQINQLATQPLGLSSVLNPLAATGGADPESLDEVRRNAPLGMISLNRAVSVQDYADFARTFTGIGKASAVRLSNGTRQIVHLTIAGAEDIPIDKNSDLYRNFLQALHQFGDPYLPIQIDIRELMVLIISAQLYENWFIETCQDWVVPYIGDLVGYQSLHSTGQLGNVTTAEGQQRHKILIPRREVANTIRYRRRKGTLSLLELLAYKVARWPARVVEFYTLLGKTEHLNHLYPPGRTTVDLRSIEALENLYSPFDELAHTVEVRQISSYPDSGRYNIPSVGVFVWRLKAYSVTRTPAFCLEEVSSNCYTFSITGNDTPLYTRSEPEIDPTHIAAELNVPMPISRRCLQSRPTDYYHPHPNPENLTKSIGIWVGTASQPRLVRPDEIIVADLSDWNYLPPRDYIAVDPELGRLAFPPRQLPRHGVWVSYHYGFSADIGGGEYDRPLLNSPERFRLCTEDVKDAASLVARLKDNAAVYRDLRAEFDRHTQNRLYAHTTSYSLEPQLIEAVISELNRLLIGDSLYEPQRFASIMLSEKTNRLAQQNPQGKQLILLNRLLLEDAFPDAIAKHFALYKVGQTEAYQRINEAIEQWQVEKPRTAIIEITDSNVYVERINIELEQNQSLQLRAANHKRPVIRILDWRTAFGDALNVTIKPGSSFILDGLLITGRGVHIESDPTQFEDNSTHVPQKPPQVIIRHSTLVPGWSLDCDCEPRRATEASLELFNTNAHITIEHSILGSIQVNQDEVQTDPMPMHISDSILDATSVDGEALSATYDAVAHVRLTIARCTVFGQIQVHAIDLAENSIFNGKLFVARRQQGCIRFCYVTPDSRTPRRYNCQPDLVEQAVAQEAERLAARHRVQPQFNSTRYGTPAYCQLADTCAEEIKRGADDESEMGVFHDLYQSLKATNLRLRLDEYTPAGMEVGIIYAS